MSLNCERLNRRCIATAMSLAIALAGCGGKAPQHTADTREQARQEASARLGDVVVRANAVPAAMLGEAVARQYGIGREPGTVLLLVGVRRGPELQETALPARITATATDLLGKRQAIAMREVRSGDPGSGPGQGFIDYVGTARVIAPDTLRFDIDVAPQDAPRMELRFSRDFFPD